MNRSLLDDPVAHHVWATLELLDARLMLSPEQLETALDAAGPGAGRA